MTGASLVFDYYAGAANKLFGQTIPVSKPGLDFTLREPIGVVGLIVPWNFPLLMASWKLGPALAAGNAVHPQAGQLLPVDGAPARRARPRSRDPGRHPQRRDRSRRDRRREHRGPSRRRQGRLHRRDDDRPGDHAAGRRQREEDQPRARRQEPEHRLRRCGPREVRGDSPYAVFDNTGQDCCARSRILVERSVHERGRRALRRGDTERSRSATRPTRRPRSARSSASSSAIGSWTTSRSGQAKAPRSSSAARRPTTRPSPTGPTSCRRSSTASRTTCGSPPRRSSVRS